MHPLSSRNRSFFAFRTDSEGDFPLSSDWPALLAALGGLPLVVSQTRNVAARLVTLGPFPALDWTPDRSEARDEASALVLLASLWSAAFARVAHCRCCGSVGRIQITDSTGVECLQVCPHPDIDPADWAALLAPFAAAPGEAVFRRPFSSFASAGSRPAPQACRVPASVVPALLDLFRREESPLLVELPSPAAGQRREMVPARLSIRHGLLTAADGVHTLQLVLPALDRVESSPGRLDAFSADGARVLSLSPVAASAGLWDEALSRL